MMRRCLFACALLLAMPATGFAQDCGEKVQRLADAAGIHLAAPMTDQATAPSAPATNESMGVAVMDHLEKPKSVIAPDGEGAAAMPKDAAQTKAEVQARRIQAEALLLEARVAAGDGRDDECRDKVAKAETLLVE